MRTASLRLPPQSAAHVPQSSAERSRLSGPLTLAAMSLGYAVVQLDVTIVNTAPASISASLGSGDFVAGAHASLVISALVLLGAATAIWQARANQASR